MNLFKKLAITATAAAALLGASATMANSYITEYDYYATSAKITVVGHTVTGCNGSTYITGTVTAHVRKIGQEPCGGFQ